MGGDQRFRGALDEGRDMVGLQGLSVRVHFLGARILLVAPKLLVQSELGVAVARPWHNRSRKCCSKHSVLAPAFI